MNSKMAGNVGVGQAIAYYTAKHYVVSLPLNDSQSYDLIVDAGSGLKRVQVKTTASKDRTVELRSTGGNKSRNTYKPFDKCGSDLLFVWSEGDMYEIPVSAIEGTTRISLGPKYAGYKVN